MHFCALLQQANQVAHRHRAGDGVLLAVLRHRGAFLPLSPQVSGRRILDPSPPIASWISHLHLSLPISSLRPCRDDEPTVPHPFEVLQEGRPRLHQGYSPLARLPSSLMCELFLGVPCMDHFRPCSADTRILLVRISLFLQDEFPRAQEAP